MKQSEKLELLAPAGNLNTLKAVINAGADAVYFGGGRFGARAYAGNLNQEEILEAIDFGHMHDRKMMLTVNTLLKEDELKEQLYEYLLPFYCQGLDAVIVQDFGVMQFIRRHFPGLSIHASTQMTVTGAAGADFLARKGASRVVLARELSLSEIRKIHQKTSVQLECFVHGALCYSYSGQCLFSSLLGGRSGNRGRCAQPCRLSYDVYGADFHKLNGKKHGYPLSPKDLCAVGLLPELASSGVYSFKIEGRMKQTEYAAGVVSVYRNCLDRYLNYGENDYFVSEQDKKTLFDLGNRCGFTQGYYKQKNGPGMITFSKSAHENKNEAAPKLPKEQKERIKGGIRILKDEPVKLEASFRDASAVVFGEIPKEAQSRPLTEEILKSRLNKTGNTPFAFEELSVELGEGLFLSMASVNELRREALERLQEAYLRRFKRKAPDAPMIREAQKPTELQAFLGASAEREEQILPLLESSAVSRIYIDSGVFQRKELTGGLEALMRQARKRKKEIYFILPAVFRDHTAVFYESVLHNMKVDGFLAKSYDALAFLLDQNIKPDKIRLDHNLYSFSAESRDAFYRLGIEGDTLPFELNRKEIRGRNNQNSEMVIYGRQPLMISAQCIRKNLEECDHMPGVCYLKDRYGVYFPVKNHCNECYNVIYNSRPLQLLPVLDELKKFGVSCFRLSFTLESGAQTKEVLKAYERHPVFADIEGALAETEPYAGFERGVFQKMPKEDYTYGHYKRGVE